MSLIHEALEKIEREKSEKRKFIAKSESVTEHAKPKESAVNSWTLYGIVGVLFLSLLLGLVFLLSSARNRDEKNFSNESTKPAIFSEPLWGIEEKFVLTGITQIGEERTAILNNLLVRVGDVIDGAKVEAIETDKVVLRLGRQIIRISLHHRQGTHFTEIQPLT